MNNIHTIGNKVTTGELAKISKNPELKGFALIAYMKDGTTTVAWSDMDIEQLVFGLKTLDLEVTNVLNRMKE